MDEIISNMENMQINVNSDLVLFVRSLNIPQHKKDQLLYLIENDNHRDYVTIYNILVENDIELPPLS
jgi:hypothetical protein